MLLNKNFSWRALYFFKKNILPPTNAIILPIFLCYLMRNFRLPIFIQFYPEPQKKGNYDQSNFHVDRRKYGGLSFLSLLFFLVCVWVGRNQKMNRLQNLFSVKDAYISIKQIWFAIPSHLMAIVGGMYRKMI